MVERPGRTFIRRDRSPSTGKRCVETARLRPSLSWSRAQSFSRASSRRGSSRQRVMAARDQLAPFTPRQEMHRVAAVPVGDERDGDCENDERRISKHRPPFRAGRGKTGAAIACACASRLQARRRGLPARPSRQFARASADHGARSLIAQRGGGHRGAARTSAAFLPYLAVTSGCRTAPAPRRPRSLQRGLRPKGS